MNLSKLMLTLRIQLYIAASLLICILAVYYSSDRSRVSTLRNLVSIELLQLSKMQDDFHIRKGCYAKSTEELRGICDSLFTGIQYGIAVIKIQTYGCDSFLLTAKPLIKVGLNNNVYSYSIDQKRIINEVIE